MAYYLGDEDHVDFDVYQFSKEGLSEDLAHYVMDEASEYEGTIQVVANDMINDIPVAWYRTLEDYEGVTYTTDTYIMDTGDEYVEVVFWFESDADIVRSHDIINTLREE